MKQIQPTENEHHWPRSAVDSVRCRKQDLVIRIADWSKDEDEPGYDIECYIGGVYDYNESECFTVHKYKSLKLAKQAATFYAQQQVEKLL